MVPQYRIFEVASTTRPLHGTFGIPLSKASQRLPAFVVLKTPVSVPRYQVFGSLGSTAIPFPTTFGRFPLTSFHVSPSSVLLKTDWELAAPLIPLIETITTCPL